MVTFDCRSVISLKVRVVRLTGYRPVNRADDNWLVEPEDKKWGTGVGVSKSPPNYAAKIKGPPSSKTHCSGLFLF